MEWIREVKLQNGFGHGTAEFEGKTKETDKIKHERNCDALTIEILEKQITEKKKARVEVNKETPKQVPCSLIPSSSGLDESTFMEEMEWIREMKIQNGIVDSTPNQDLESSSPDKVMKPENLKSRNEISHEALEIQKLENIISFKRSNSQQVAEKVQVDHKELNEDTQISWENSSMENVTNVQSNSLGVDDSVLLEEMEWAREMTLQNGNNSDTGNNPTPTSYEQTIQIPSPVPSKREKKSSSEADKINELEKLISEKVSQSKEHENRHQKINEPHLSNGCSNSLGLDESVFQEEMDWIREVRSQNNISTFEKPEKVSSPVLKEIEKESQRNEVDKIQDLERQISEKINKAKAEEAARKRQEKEKEDQELLQRLQEEMDLAEEMRQIEEEDNRKRIEEEERQRKAIEDAKTEETRRKKIQDEKDMLSKLEQMVLQKLTTKSK